MKPETQLEYVEYLERAQGCKLGLELTFETADEGKLFRAKLYAARKGFPEFEAMTFVLRNAVLWIIKGNPDE